MENQDKYCMACGTKGVKDLSKECYQCGHTANGTYQQNYCYNCGKPNQGYKICQHCRTRLSSQKNHFVLLLLACFPLLPFYKFYAGRNMEGIIHLVLLVISFIFLGISPSIIITIICFLILIVWYTIDVFKIFFGFPRGYTDGDGLHLF